MSLSARAGRIAVSPTMKVAADAMRFDGVRPETIVMLVES